MTEPTTERYVPTDQDLRSNALYTAERLVTERMRCGASDNVPDPAALTIEYAERIYNYIKTGEIK